MLIYCSGPLQNCTEAEARGWREETKVLLKPYSVSDPSERWCRDGYGKLTESEKRELVERDLEEIRKCDGVLACCWKPSVGTAQEIVYSKQWRKPTVVVQPSLDPSPWLVAHSDYLCTSVMEGVDWLKWRLGRSKA